jgi:CTP synthase
MGIAPDIIVARADEPLEPEIISKLSMFCNVKSDCVIENLTLPCLYGAPIMLYKNGLDKVVCRELSLNVKEPDLAEWAEMTERIGKAAKTASIAIVGKYVRLHDAYLSVMEALRHAGYALGANVDIIWVDSESVNDSTVDDLIGGAGGVVVPGGFGDRGIEGKIRACKYARENNLPYLGLCLGMHIAVIETARAAGLKSANSREFDACSEHLVINLMADQEDITDVGGTMRLGAYPCAAKPGSLLERLYGGSDISERHRHRYELNNKYRNILEENGMAVSGQSPDGKLAEAVEIPKNDFFIAVQFHPEFKSRPNRAHPLFKGLVEAALRRGVRAGAAKRKTDTV